MEKGSGALDMGRFLNLVWLIGEVLELRIHNYNTYGPSSTGCFENLSVLANTVIANDITNLYTSPNSINSDPITFSELHIMKEEMG